MLELVLRSGSCIVATLVVFVFPVISQDHGDGCWLKKWGGLYEESKDSDPLPPNEIQRRCAIEKEMISLSKVYEVPYEIIVAVCYHEGRTMWQYKLDLTGSGKKHTTHNIGECEALFIATAPKDCPASQDCPGGNEGEPTCPPGLGMMQLTGCAARAFDSPPWRQLAGSWKANLKAGVELLRRHKYAAYASWLPGEEWSGQVGNPRLQLQPLLRQSRHLIENWYMPVWMYRKFQARNQGYADDCFRWLAKPPEEGDMKYFLREGDRITATSPETVFGSHFGYYAGGKGNESPSPPGEKCWKFVALMDGSWWCAHGISNSKPVTPTAVIRAGFDYNDGSPRFKTQQEIGWPGCKGSNGLSPSLTGMEVNGVPRIGSNYAIQLSNAKSAAEPGDRWAQLLMGLSDHFISGGTFYGCTPVKCGREIEGMPGCFQYASLDWEFFIPFDSAGRATFPVDVPNKPELVGTGAGWYATLFPGCAA